ncbi:histidine phosphatase family protein [Microbacterium sp. OR16]|uniref:histidine phosphatase family protein n=1 Tax=Microbacterium sp. OR16 TaxID=3095345 RepID=UPI0039B4B788
MSALIRVHLVRHGEAVFNVEHKYQGQADSGLTERGRGQAAAVGAALAELIPAPAAVITSDLPRTVATSEPYTGIIGMPAEPEEDWREIDVGTWAGRTFEEMSVAEPDVFQALARGEDVARGGGETFSAARVRIERALARIERRLAGAAEGADVVVFSHGGPIRLAAAIVAGLPSPGHSGIVSPANCSVTTLHLGSARGMHRYNHDPVGRSNGAAIDREEVV